jgi:uncharacterized Zn finger protein
MSETKPQCPTCQQRVLQSLSTRCMYCGTELPKNLHATDAQKQAILSRHEESNREHDLAMEAKAKKANKKKKEKPSIQPPFNIS